MLSALHSVSMVGDLQYTTQDTHVLLVPCAEMTHVQWTMHVRTTQALGNIRAPCVEFRDIRLTSDCMWFQHVLFCSVGIT